MKKLLIMIILSILLILTLFTSCSMANKPTPNDVREYSKIEEKTEVKIENETEDEVEDIEQQSTKIQYPNTSININWTEVPYTTEKIYSYPFDELYEETVYYLPGMYYDDYVDEEYDRAQQAAFITEYLIDHGMYKETPDKVIYNEQGLPLAEYYIDKENSKFSFIIYIWGDYWINYDAGKRMFTSALYCITLHANDSYMLGSLISGYENDIAYESFYDLQGDEVASISYEYISGVPFPFIIDYSILDYDLIDYSANYLVRDVLCRNHKKWLYKEQAQFDDAGRFIHYNGLYRRLKDYIVYPSTCIYNTDDKLDKILIELYEFDIEMEWYLTDDNENYSGIINFYYHDNGNIRFIKYVRSPYSHETTDSNGEIFYDKNERMLHYNYYVTHGSHTNIFLYEDYAEKPWAFFDWCSHGGGFDQILLFL